MRMQKRNTRTVWHWLALVSQLGFALITPIVVCTAAAYWLSERFGLGGIPVILGIFLGLGGAAVSFLKVMRLAQRTARGQEDEDA